MQGIVLAIVLGLIPQLDGLEITQFRIPGREGFYQTNTIDGTNSDFQPEIHFAFTLGENEMFQRGTIQLNGEDRFRVFYENQPPEGLSPLQGQGLDFGWEFAKPGEGGIRFYQSLVLYHGFYKLFVKAFNTETDEVVNATKTFYAPFISNCTSLDGFTTFPDTCLFDVYLECQRPIYPMANFKALMYMSSKSDYTFVRMLPDEAVIFTERDDGRFDVVVKYAINLTDRIPADFFFKAELYNDNRVVTSWERPFTKHASCTSSGSGPTSAPNAHQQIQPRTFYPEETPVYWETTEPSGTTNSSTEGRVTTTATRSSAPMETSEGTRLSGFMPACVIGTMLILRC